MSDIWFSPLKLTGLRLVVPMGCMARHYGRGKSFCKGFGEQNTCTGRCMIVANGEKAFMAWLALVVMDTFRGGRYKPAGDFPTLSPSL